MSGFIDWRGNPIQVGDTVLYPPPGHAELYECVVIDLYQKWRDGGVRGWTRITPKTPAPDGAEAEWRALLQGVRRARPFPVEPMRSFRVTETCNLTLIAPAPEQNPAENTDRGTA